MRIYNFAAVIFYCFCFSVAIAQPGKYTVSNAHSHNDYRQQQPFSLAYNEQFGSIEADVFLVGKSLLVAHDSAELSTAPTLEKVYILPLAALLKKNKGQVYADAGRQLQLMIDFKTEGVATADALIQLLKQYPIITRNRNIKIVISGNRPAENLYSRYPAYIWFDGNLGEDYSPASLRRIAMFSDDFGKYSKWKGEGAFPDSAKLLMLKHINQAHKLDKPVRFWASPDDRLAWKELMDLKVDYVNTDHIAALSDFFSRNSDSLRLMPYNRIIKSAGEVIRYGNADLENHALDVALLDDGKLVIEDRYGIMALDADTKKILARWTYTDLPMYRKYMSVYSGIQSFSDGGKTWVVWTAAEKDSGNGAVMIAEWSNGFSNISSISIAKKAPAANALPNEIAVNNQQGEWYLYVVINGNNELIKYKWSNRSIVWAVATGVAPYGIAIANEKAYVSNWAGPLVTDSTKESAGVPWGLAYTDPRTGATAKGTLSVFETSSGKLLKEITTGLHPNVVRASKDGSYVYIANGSSDEITVVNTKTNLVTETIEVGLLRGKYTYQGSTPNGLEISADNKTLYVSNGLDNAVAVISLGKKAATGGKATSQIAGFIPTEAYPAGLKISNKKLIITNLEAEGANVINTTRKARSIHNQLASVSIIPLPGKEMLDAYTQQVAQLNLINRTTQLQLQPRPAIAAVPVPERLGEPSVFKHVVYIIKENKTYDQVYGDIEEGRGDSSLCVFGEKITPNMHALANQFGWMDDYYASGKSSAEGHQWTDGAMVSDYVEKNVRAWFRSYPHRQEDALVYNKSGFIWNHALDNGKSVRVFGEACETIYDKKLKWADLYKNYQQGKQPDWYNKTTIARLRPIISPTFPDCDDITFSDQQRADIFIQEWKQYEKGGNLPNLMVVSLPNDHSAGTSPDYPTPNAMVADNDLAVGRIIEMITKSKYWDSTVVFITQDDSQSGWDHISAYRTIGLTVSAYSSGRLVTSNYNQTSMLRTIEQILELPPMNVIDATARLMTDCFQPVKNTMPYKALQNNIPIDQMNKPLKALVGKERKFALQSQHEVFNEIDGGADDAMNRIIWQYAKGDIPYPGSK